MFYTKLLMHIFNMSVEFSQSIEKNTESSKESISQSIILYIEWSKKCYKFIKNYFFIIKLLDVLFNKSVTYPQSTNGYTKSCKKS